MPEADPPANQHSPAPTDPFPETNLGDPSTSSAELLNSMGSPVPPRPEDEDWQTVDFPNAISVDEIPLRDKTEGIQQSPAGNPQNSAPTTQPSPPANRPLRPPTVLVESLSFDLAKAAAAAGTGGTPATLIQALHECNRDLVQRVAQLEVALEECHNRLQEQQGSLEQRQQETQTAQAEVSRLFGKLELANQIIQRQEVLHETLTQQLEASQLRLALMERECALTQQRYNEQQHQLVQAENSCRELRSRLHRQQRHTLQFKAALERCLEMPAAKSQFNFLKSEPLEDFTSSGEILEETSEQSEVAIGRPAPRSTPVQPWSATWDTSEEVKVNAEASQQGGELEPPNRTSEPETPKVEAETFWHLESTHPVASPPGAEAEPPVPSVPSPSSDSQTLSLPHLDPHSEPPTDRLSFTVSTASGEPRPLEISTELFQAPSGVEAEWSNQPTQPRTTAQSSLPNWLRTLSYASSSKKRRSLAEIELPTFS
ncbi:MAG: hypothetical protein ACM37W_20785 [Actinomycetota bacterium]